MEDLTARIIAALRKAAQDARNADEAGEPTALADALEAMPAVSAVEAALNAAAVAAIEKLAAMSTPAQPPVDNEHVAPGAEPFSDEVVAANKPAPPAEDHDAQP